VTIRRFIPLALTLALLGGALWLFQDQLSLRVMAARIAAADPLLLAAAAACYAVGVVGATLRYQFILERATGSAVSFTYLLLLSFFSYLSGYLAPVSVAGEVLRTAFTKKYLQVGYIQSARYVVIDKMLALVSIAALALAAVPFKLFYGVNGSLVAIETAMIVAFFVALSLICWPGLRVLARVPRLGGLAAALRDDVRFAIENFSRPRDLAWFAICSLLAVGGFGLGIVFTAHAMALDIGAAVLLSLAPTILLVQNAPFFYAGFGAREGLLLVATAEFARADPSLVLGFSVMIGVMLLITCIPGSLAFLMVQSRR
jgi:hypothetical protein